MLLALSQAHKFGACAFAILRSRGTRSSNDVEALFLKLPSVLKLIFAVSIGRSSHHADRFEDARSTRCEQARSAGLEEARSAGFEEARSDRFEDLAKNLPSCAAA